MKNSILLEFVLTEVRKSSMTQRQIAEATGVPYSTLTKIIQRTIEDPGVTHVEALAKFFGWQFESIESENSDISSTPGGLVPSPQGLGSFSAEVKHV